MADILMKCGCRANATFQGKQCCAVHLCVDVTETQPNLEGRQAKCAYGQHGIVNSSLSLPFFEYHGPGSAQGERPMDTYYCGCHGWD